MKVGDKVICIDGSKQSNKDYSMFNSFPIEGHKYTVRRIESNPMVGERVLLKEITNRPMYFEWLQGKLEPAFAKKRFMLLDDYNEYLIEVNESIENQEYIRFE